MGTVDRMEQTATRGLNMAYTNINIHNVESVDLGEWRKAKLENGDYYYSRQITISSNTRGNITEDTLQLYTNHGGKMPKSINEIVNNLKITYTMENHDDEITEMAEKLATSKVENMSNLDVETMLLEGVEPYAKKTSGEIEREYEEVFGAGSWDPSGKLP